MLLWHPVQSIDDDLGQAAKQLNHALPGAILLPLPLNGIVQVLFDLLSAALSHPLLYSIGRFVVIRWRLA